MKIRKFASDGKYFFQLIDDAGTVLLNSEDYESATARDNGLRSVRENASDPDRYKAIAEGGEYYYVLRAGNNQEIGRSPAIQDEQARDELMAALQKYDGGEAYGNDGRTDDYKPLYFYEDNCEGVDRGFDPFSADGEHYFSYNIDGTIYLISEGYTSAASRDNGMNSVERNLPNRDRYQEKQHPNGMYYFNLRAGNNQEIATSRWFESEGEMQRIIGQLTGESLVAANRVASVNIDPPPPPAEPKEKKPRKKRTTEKKPKAEKVHIDSGDYHFNDVNYQLFRSGNDKHYFTFKNADGKTVLMNSDVRGFETPEEGQEKIKQVLKYAPDESNYEGKMTRNGKYYFYLKGDDGKNIAKSFFYNTEDEMQMAIGGLLGDVGAMKAAGEGARARTSAVVDDYLPVPDYAAHLGDRSDVHEDFIAFEQDGEHYFAWADRDRVYMRSEGYTTTKARDNGIQSVLKNRDIEARYGTVEDEDGYCVTLKAGNHQEIARSGPYEDAAAANAWYTGRLGGLGAAAAGLAAMTSSDDVVVESTSSDEPRSDASDHTGIKTAAGVALAGAAASIGDKDKDKDKEDDYLRTELYEGRKVSDAKNNVALFKHDGQHYFAMYDDNGDVALRSEGFPSAKKREGELSRALRFRKDNSMYKRIERGDRAIDVLYDKKGREVARSGIKDKNSKMGWWGAAAAATAAAVSAASTTKTTSSDEVTNGATTGEGATRVAAAGSGGARGASGSDDGGGGFKWWWLLPLLLLPLLWMVMRGCGDDDKGKNNKAKTEIVKTTPVQTNTVDAEARKKAEIEAAASAKAEADRKAAEEAAKRKAQAEAEAKRKADADAAARRKAEADAAAKRAAALAATNSGDCDCGNQSARIFRIPNTTPKNITKLGSLPEFGNSHDLSPSQFYDKLADRYSSNSDDRDYLDYLFKSMGYRNGFADAAPGMFSDRELARGTRGILGFGEYHGYAYSQLNTSEYDRQAFRIKAANGCDVHFMKTCGNYMYFCE